MVNGLQQGDAQAFHRGLGVCQRDVRGILEDVSADKWLANSASGNESGNERPLSLPLSLAVVKDR